MSEIAIQTFELAKRFGHHWAVKDLELKVPQGSVFGLLGPNGAGKSTTIKMLMGLLPSTQGYSNVLNLNPKYQSVELRQKVGFVPETYGFYDWMTIDQHINLVAPYHTTWNHELCGLMLAEFKLKGYDKVGSLSKGMKAKLALLLSLAFEPEMLILDEPTGGLDPAARRNFIETILSCFQEAGKTILVSSHLLNEFSGLLDHVAFMRDGRLEMVSRLDDLHRRMKRIRLIFDEHVPSGLAVANSLSVRTNGREALVTCSEFDPEHTENELAKTGASQVNVEEMSLEDIFVDLVGS